MTYSIINSSHEFAAVQSYRVHQYTLYTYLCYICMCMCVHEHEEKDICIHTQTVIMYSHQCEPIAEWEAFEAAPAWEHKGTRVPLWPHTCAQRFFVPTRDWRYKVYKCTRRICTNRSFLSRICEKFQCIIKDWRKETEMCRLYMILSHWAVVSNLSRSSNLSMRSVFCFFLLLNNCWKESLKMYAIIRLDKNSINYLNESRIIQK